MLYIVSCAPGPLWQDSGLIQLRVWHNDIEGFLGLAISHPLFYILAIGAKYIPLGEFAHRVNLVSAIAAAVAVANTFLLVRLWLGRNFPAVTPYLKDWIWKGLEQEGIMELAGKDGFETKVKEYIEDFKRTNQMVVDDHISKIGDIDGSETKE